MWLLWAVMKEGKRCHPFHTNAMVILPDHLHTVWTLSVGDRD
jgi:putative transposase